MRFNPLPPPTPLHQVNLLGGASGKSVQLAYVLDEDNWTIWVSRSGHAAILSEIGLRGSAGSCSGGWIYPAEGKVSGSSGYLGEVKEEDLDDVIDCIGQALGVQLRRLS